MPESMVEVEELQGGLRGVFFSMPHFRTTSARLTIHSGAAHESADTAGAAHFLEHINFQGTEEFPTEEAVEQFAEDNGLNHNAYTGLTETRYIADGYSVPAVAQFVTQLALFPTLSEAALERERNPIFEELRTYMSDPLYDARAVHATAKRGQHLGRPIGGSVEAVAHLTHAHLLDFYNSNYRLNNASLVVCSSEPVAKQREYVEALLEGVPTPPLDRSPQLLKIPPFNPDNLPFSLQLVDLPPNTQTHLNVVYGIPEIRSVDDRYRLFTAAQALSKLMHRKLRSEMALSYGANASMGSRTNISFGASQVWGELAASVSLAGPVAIEALEATRDILSYPLPQPAVERAIASTKRAIDHVMQGDPAETADHIASFMSADRRCQFDLEEMKHLGEAVTADQIQASLDQVLATQPMVIATSPDETTLDRIADWATGKI